MDALADLLPQKGETITIDFLSSIEDGESLDGRFQGFNDIGVVLVRMGSVYRFVPWTAIKSIKYHREEG